MQDQSDSTFLTAWKLIKLGVGCLLFLFGLFLLRPDSEYIQQMQRLEDKGRSTQAKLINKIEGRSSSPTGLPPGVGGALGAAARGFAAGKRLSDSPDRRSNGEGIQDYGRLFYLEYVFKTPTGEQIKDKAIVSADAFDRIAVGAMLSVTYLPENPKINRLTNYGEPFKRIPQSILIGVSIVIGSIGAFLIWFNWPWTAKGAAGVAAGVAQGGGRNGGQGHRRVTNSVGVSRVASPVGRGFHAPRKSFD
jgi:hypothetical protein